MLKGHRYHWRISKYLEKYIYDYGSNLFVPKHRIVDFDPNLKDFSNQENWRNDNLI